MTTAAASRRSRPPVPALADPIVAGPVVDQVRHRFAQEGGPASGAAVVAAVRAQPAAAVLGDTALLSLADQVHADLVGAGPLTPLLRQPGVTDVLVNRTDVWVDRGHGLQRVPVAVGSPEDVRRLAQRLAAAGGRRLDDSSPCVDVRLADGTRLHAALPPIAVDGPYLALRMLTGSQLPHAGLSRHALMPGYCRRFHIADTSQARSRVM